MARHQIALGVLWRFVGYGAVFGFWGGGLYGLFGVPTVSLIVNGTLPSDSASLMATLAVVGTISGGFLGLIMSLVVGLFTGLLMLGLLNIGNGALGNSFRVFGAFFSALVALLFCILLFLWIEPLHPNEQNFMGTVWSLSIILAIIMLSCAWAGYRIAAWVVRLQDQPLEVWDEPY